MNILVEWRVAKEREMASLFLVLQSVHAIKRVARKSELRKALRIV